MFSFFKKKPKQNFTDFSFLGVDIHSHLLPGIDDGAKTMNDTLALAKGLQALGFHKIITTPHVMSGYYPNSSDTIRTKGEEVKGALGRNNINVEFGYSAEYYMDEHFEELVANNDIIPLHNKLVLFELSFVSAPSIMENLVFQLKINGFQPILAHPERYLYWSRDFKKYQRFKDMGCLFQLNLLSVIGHYGPEVEKNTKKMLKENFFDLAGTDTHHIDHIKKLETGLAKGQFGILSDYPFKNETLFT